jgi:hypothetical protein
MIVLARRLHYVWNVSEAIGNGSLTTLPETSNERVPRLSGLEPRTHILARRGKIVPHSYAAYHRDASGTLRSPRAYRSGWHGRGLPC